MADIGVLYQRRFLGSVNYRDRVWKVLCRDFFQAFVPQTGSEIVVDLGCGYGEFINHIRAANRVAVDLNPDSVDFVGEGVAMHTIDAKELPNFVTEADVVFSSNFLEHLPAKSEVELVLNACYSGLKRGGRLILMGPNVRYLPGSYWDFWDHYVPLTEKSITEILETLGFEIVQVYPRFLPYTMSNGRRPPFWAVRLYLRLKIFWPLFGRQFLVVASKKN